MTKQGYFTNEEIILLDWIQGKITRPNEAFSIEKAHLFALKNGLSPYLFHRIKDNKEIIPDELYPILKKDYFNALFRNTRIQNVWKEIQELLNAHHLSFVPLKGIFLAQYIYPDFNTRPMSDLDILIMYGQAQQAFDLLVSKGAQHSGEKQAAHDKKTGHHLPGIIFKGVLIELHTSLFPLDVDYQIPNDLIEKSLIKYDNVFTLPPMLNFCYLCMHAYSTMRRGGIRLSWFLDLVLLSQSEYFKADKLELTKIIQQLNIQVPVLDVMKKAEFLFDYRFEFVPKSLQGSLSTTESSVFVRLIQESGQQNTDYSYAIAFERLKNTKGLGNKLRFIKSVLLRGDNTRVTSLIKRLWTVTTRSFRMFLSKSR
ncbi:nucleotidyltransferase family protein [Saccharicrinis sp. GN24d3]|uniref:nucleotidyltransferase family protein n=1 Tax=Saccharicrinis sp. GN24d3 TaxID=3458416 RepID=UPI0040374666